FYPTDVEPWEPNITTLIDFDRKWKKMISPDIPVPTPATEQYEGIIGVYEGGGYAAKGVYRPRMDCLMNTFKGDTFCDVCKTAIQRMIDFYTN
ncbi:MAG: peptidase M64, partial [Sphingobacteriia bacterium]|nr:peptidase M64 [Sphingobacteriia bacterium]